MRAVRKLSQGPDSGRSPREKTLTSKVTAEFAQLVGSHETGGECFLYLPEFRGAVELQTGGSQIPPLRYPGHTFSECDARAAFHVTSVLANAFEPDHIHLENAGALDRAKAGKQTAFLFGSRSNSITQWVMEHRAPQKFFRFEFGDKWAITCVDGQVFAVPDPSKLTEEAYVSHSDYGVIAKFLDSPAQTQFFVIAGLGSRATEGCGYFFAQHWRDLAGRFGPQGFAVILEFPPPVEPSSFRPVAWFPRS